MIEGSLFDVDDQVKVNGYNDKIFRVITVSYKNRYIHGIKFEGFLYKLIDINKPVILEDVFEDDMTLHKRNRKEPDIKLSKEQIKWQEYEDNLMLYDLFGDEKYQDAAVEIYCELIHNRDNK